MQDRIDAPSLRLLALAGLGVAAAIAALWAMGQLDPFAVWARAQQREVQSALAGGVRAVRAGHPGAWAGLMTVCFSYGFLHAAGPGHGKAVIAGYGMARRVRLVPLAGLALAASMAQAAFAVALVYAGVWALGWSRERVEGLAETTFLPLSYGMVAAVGLWLVWRGLRGAARARHGGAGEGDHAHAHAHAGDEDCGCGHAHGPTARQVAAVTSVRDAALLVVAIALRPCSGALFLLVVTYAMGIGLAGVAGTFAMGFGTALVTVATAGLAFWAREGALVTLPGAGMAQALPLIEVAVGALIAATSLVLLLPLI